MCVCVHIFVKFTGDSCRIQSIFQDVVSGGSASFGLKCSRLAVDESDGDFSALGMVHQTGVVEAAATCMWYDR